MQGSCSSAEPLAQTALVPNRNVGTAPSAAGLLMRSGQVRSCKTLAAETTKPSHAPCRASQSVAWRKRPAQALCCMHTSARQQLPQHPQGRTNAVSISWNGTPAMPGPEQVEAYVTITATAARQALARLRGQLPKFTLSIHGGLPDRCESLLHCPNYVGRRPACIYG